MKIAFPTQEDNGLDSSVFGHFGSAANRMPAPGDTACCGSSPGHAGCAGPGSCCGKH